MIQMKEDSWKGVIFSLILSMFKLKNMEIKHLLQASRVGEKCTNNINNLNPQFGGHSQFLLCVELYLELFLTNGLYAAQYLSKLHAVVLGMLHTAVYIFVSHCSVRELAPEFSYPSHPVG